jgi:methylthioribulose-1-phosphate dehydratase
MSKRVEAALFMAEAARAFYAHGWLMGTSGNLSVRLDANTFLISASGKDKGTLSVDDFLVCNLDAEPIEPTHHKPSAETRVHGVLYRKYQDVGAIFHCHEPYAALCSSRDANVGHTKFEGLEMIKGLNIWDEHACVEVPIVPNHADIPSLAIAIGDAAQETVPGVNVLRHGFYAWGAGPFEAKRHVESLAYLYRYSWEWSRR